MLFNKEKCAIMHVANSEAESCFVWLLANLGLLLCMQTAGRTNSNWTMDLWTVGLLLPMHLGAVGVADSQLLCTVEMSNPISLALVKCDPLSNLL